MSNKAEDSGSNSPAPQSNKRKEDKEKDKYSKRQKITLSCTECRRRKIKCDHKKPICENCIKKNLQDQCTYSTSPWIQIISSENQIYEEIKSLKKENDLLIKNITLLKEQYGKFNGEGNNNNNSGSSTNNGHNSTHDDLSGGSTASPSSNNPLTPSSTTSIQANSQGNKEDTIAKQLSNLLLKSIVSRIRSLDDSIITIPPKFNSPLTPMLTLKINNDKKYKEIFLDQLLINYLPSFEIIEYHINYFFNSNFFKNLQIISQSQILNSFNKMFNKIDKKIQIDPKREIQDFLQLAIILTILKITSVYKDTPFTDPENKLILYIDASLGFGELITRSSIPALQAVILVNSYRLFVQDMNEIDLYFLIQLCQDFAIAIGLHKNIDVLYEDKTLEEREMLKTIWNCLNDTR
ncbi:Zinc finger transcription factor YRR1 [Wickerhamomyces ciferrii]|uniref:Zinc finger transcription factor YRR1 n=1 Tax=Wickerhamomyces ciferrii (strain ATCC 14091 / BCRC 22168 / CBS 111 / JCM 3599 / NBRC 0793 / NRRL Y-1031 F-60-10) TaxID=1206466 RepID=K0KW05_WICCF|nr:Zinc finger transcription factor YRR1 [Wickerhamomyces ciferrii]CCH46162.1 Zinc finger transcription factor YRR1 [Wickerhamomyces ciferrii]